MRVVARELDEWLRVHAWLDDIQGYQQLELPSFLEVLDGVFVEAAGGAISLFSACGDDTERRKYERRIPRGARLRIKP